VPELVEGHEWVHLLPHVLQVVGGTAFALIAWLALDVRLRTKEEALLEAEGARLREQLERSQRLSGLGQLAGGVAHDFNNLLAVIGGYGRLLDRRLADRPELRADVREIVTAAERGAELTRQMLVFSRGSERELEVGDINRAIEGSETLLRRAAGEQVDLRLVLAADVSLVGLGRGRIEQILLNLTLNARDAMPAGGTLTIATEPDGDEVRLTIVDTGEGMPPEVVAHAFDPFFTTKPEGEGTGLGLSVVYGIIERAGGRIAIESTPGTGTRFTIALPTTQAAVPEEPAPEREAGSLRGVTVLVVDDQESVRTLVTRILEGCDAQVIGVPDGQAALDAMAEFEDAVDIVLTDIVMPGMSGIELAGQLRSERPALPLVYFSGYSGAAETPDGPIIRKPFTPAEVVTAVADALPARLLAGR
jgi:signal transduction histidine kinase